MEKDRQERDRAYRSWEDEGRPEGRHEEHWHSAEREFDKEDGSAEDASAAEKTADTAGKGGKQDSGKA